MGDFLTKVLRRSKENYIGLLIDVLSLVGFIVIVVYSFVFFEDTNRIGIAYLSLLFVLFTLHTKKNHRFLLSDRKLDNILCLVMLMLSLGVGLYFYMEYPLLLHVRAGDNTVIDLIMGTLAIILTIFVTWKTTGKAIPLVCFLFIIYAIFGKILPGALWHPGMSLIRIIQVSAVEINGIYGSILVIGISYVFVFLLYAGMIEGFGGLSFIVETSFRITKKFKFGLPQTAVIASMLFGSFSGSAPANVAGTGAFTIPAMKRYGLSPNFAAAVESVASSGGQIVPPIMGSAAFLMADFLKVPYWTVLLMAVPGAFIFYASVAFSVYLRTSREIQHTDSGPKLEDSRVPINLLEGIPIGLSIIMLLLLLGYFRLSIMVSGVYTIFCFLVARFIYDMIYSNYNFPNLIKAFSAATLNGIRTGMESVLSIIPMFATLGIIIQLLVSTGVAQTLAFSMVDLSGGNLNVLLLLIAIICLFLGVAVVTLVAYLMVVMLAAPALETFGIPSAATHFAVLYLALISAITPPVAIAVAVACSISKSSFWGSCWEAIKLGLPLIILPFAFIEFPALVAMNIETTTKAAFLVLTAMLGISYAVHGAPSGKVQALKKMVFGTSGFLVIFWPGYDVKWEVVSIMLILFGISRLLLYINRRGLRVGSKI